MSGPAQTHKDTTDGPPESPTTVKPFDMDDDDDGQESGVIGEAPTSPTPARTSSMNTGNTNTNTTTTSTAAAPTATEEVAPPKPPRPMTEAQKNEMILREAFPDVDLAVIKAILTASGGRVEPAFNALLEMTDPDAVKNEPQDVPPPQPPRPQNRAQLSQLEADELYARQLAEHYDNVGAYEQRTSNRGGPDGRPQMRQGDERERSFIDDDLPVIRENLRKGFIETQSKVNDWITTFKKKIEENFDESEGGQNQQHQQQQQHQQNRRDPFHRPGESSRRSGDYDRYDADPEVLSDDFAGMKFAADGTPVGNRPMANTGMYKPPPSSHPPKPHDGRRVGFKEETEEINMYDTSPRVPPKDTSPAGGKASKWQPLSTVDPDPITDNDPFSLGDSEDERETKPKEMTKEATKDTKLDDDAERLKKAAAEAMSESLVDAKKGDATKKS